MSDLADRPESSPGPHPPARPFGFAAGLIGRNPDVAGLSVAMLLGVGLLIAGLEVVRVSPQWGFSYTGAIDGLLSQLSVTGPAAILVAIATTANVLAGAILLRLLGRPAFGSPSELVLAGFAAAVVLDALALFLLGSLGLFGWPELMAIHAALAAGYLAVHRRESLLAAPLRFRVSRPAVWWIVVVAVWAGPLIVQLASPAVPFQDVLPNHVAPVEHARVFGSFSTLTTSPSPIYGPSRLMLGYVALLGQLTTITNLDAILADAAFAFPLTILVALAIRRLAGELFGGSASFWVLLTFPLTFTFMRLPDSRGTVVVFPLAAWALCTIAAELRERSGGGAGAAAAHRAGSDAAPRVSDDGALRDVSSSRLPDLGLTFAIGGAFLVHPLVGLVAATAAAGALILYPGRLARGLVPALGAGAVMAVPQILTMGAIDAPSWVGAVCLVGAVALAFGLARAAAALAPIVHGAARFTTSDWGRAALVAAAIVSLLILARIHIPASLDPTQPADPAGELMLDFPYLVWLALGGAILAAFSTRRLGRGWIVLGCGIAAGLAAWTASGFVGYADLTQQAVHYEVPKSVEYWLPVMLALGAAGALAAVCRLRGLGPLRPPAIALFLAVAMFPITMPLTTNVQIGEHRGAESVGLALREAQLGYWAGYPDARRIIDLPRQQVVDYLRAEEEAGRLGPSTRVLHIADTFQQWASVPIGVFTGAIETSVSQHPELSIHTEGGRLLGFDQLATQVSSGYGYVVLEPSQLTAAHLAAAQSALATAGYHQVWSNSQATVYTRT